jgi:hypothetical protein
MAPAPAPASATTAAFDRVVSDARAELGLLVQTSSPTTKSIAATLAATYVLNLLAPSLASTFALVPERTIPFCVWNVFTAGYYEQYLASAVVNVLGTLYLGRCLEPIWGAEELVRFVVLVNLAVGCAAFVTMYLLYVATYSQFYIFAKFSGFHGVLVALTVAVRQQLPLDRVPLPNPLYAVLKIRNKDVPGLYCAGAAALCVFSGAEHHHIGLYLFVLYGAFFGWAYLRYFQPLRRRDANGNEIVQIGDDRREMSFAAQFPEFLEPLVARATDPLHGVFFGERRGVQRGSSGGGGDGHAGASSLTGVMIDDDDAAAAAEEEEISEEERERKRELAAKGAAMLEARLKAKEVPPPPPPPPAE